MATKKKATPISTSENVATTPAPAGGSEAIIRVKPLNMKQATFKCVGTAPYVQLRFSMKSRNIMEETQRAGSQAKSKRVRAAKDFEGLYEDAMYVMEDGSYGIPAAAFRAAAISACRLVGYKMTMAKLSLFIEADGEDALDGTPLVRLEGTPEMRVDNVRNANGSTDLRPRAMWRKWNFTLTVRWDGDQFSIEDMTNLLYRVGQQVGVGEGRPDSRSSAGMGWGLFQPVLD